MLASLLQHNRPIVPIGSNAAYTIGKTSSDEGERPSRRANQRNHGRQRSSSVHSNASSMNRSMRDGRKGRFETSYQKPEFSHRRAGSTSSYEVKRERSSIPQPPPTRAGKKSMKFTSWRICYLCGQSVHFSSKRAWQRHLFLDLKPYQCLELECPNPEATFAKQGMLLNHYEAAHPQATILNADTYTCIFCEETLLAARKARFQHLARHLEESAFSIVPQQHESWSFYSDSSSGDDENISSFLELLERKKDSHHEDSAFTRKTKTTLSRHRMIRYFNTKVSRPDPPPRSASPSPPPIKGIPDQNSASVWREPRTPRPVYKDRVNRRSMSKADIFEAKVAAAVEEAASSSSSSISPFLKVKVHHLPHRSFANPGQARDVRSSTNEYVDDAADDERTPLVGSVRGRRRLEQRRTRMQPVFIGSESSILQRAWKRAREFVAGLYKKLFECSSARQ